MQRMSYRVNGESVTVNVVECVDDLYEVGAWVAAHPASEPIEMDTETTGPNPYAKGFRLRVIQLGDGQTAYVLPVDERPAELVNATRDMVRLMLDREPMWSFHNVVFDLLVLHRSGYLDHIGLEKFHEKVVDTYLMAHLLDPRAKGEDNAVGHGLKELSTQWVDLWAADTQAGLIEVFRKDFKKTKDTGWAADGLTKHPTYLLYAGLDVIYGHRLYRELKARIIARGFGDLFQWEREIQRATMMMQARGVKIDVEYTQQLSQRLMHEAERYKEVALGYGVENINSTAQVADGLTRSGAILTARTPSGALSVGKEVLNPLAGLTDRGDPIEGATVHPLAEAVAKAKRAGKWRKAYVDAFLTTRDENDRVHPGIKSLAARTARMCLPETEKLVTKRGVLHVDDVRVGDLTVGRDGEWTPVREVHRYAGADVVKYQVPGARYHVVSTPEHRWLWSSPRGVQHLAPISSTRPTLHLAPPTKTDLFSGREFLCNTDGERWASIIGLLVTDGRCISPMQKNQVGMSAMIYQTEAKFYSAILDLLPAELVSYNRITDGGDHHEIGLRIRMLRPILEARGLVPDAGQKLKDHPGLLTWAAGLSLPEAAAFVRAAYLADGSTAWGHKVITAMPSVYREALRLCAYRCGWLSTVFSRPPSEWGTRNQEVVSFRAARLYLRDRVETHSVANVWCVSTDDGMFTAAGDGLGEGATYLTGNSISDPPLQQLPAGDYRIRRCFIPDDGKVFISSDFSQIELRVLAANAGVEEMKKAIDEGDKLHNRTLGLIWGPEVRATYERGPEAAGYWDAKKKYGTGKNTSFCYVYGGGAAKIAQTASIPVPEAREVIRAFERAYPEIPGYARSLQDQAASNDWIVRTPFGRELPVSPNKSYAALNYMIQSSSRDLFAEALLKVDKALPGVASLVIHDEILHQAPVEVAQEQASRVRSLMTRKYRGVEIDADSDVAPGGSWGSLYGCPKELDREIGE